MMRLPIGLVAMFALIAPAGAGAQAQEKQAVPSQANSAADSMNEIVCEKQEVLGSRLATKRICKTRAEWAEQRRSERMEVEKVQVQRGSCDGCQ